MSARLIEFECECGGYVVACKASETHSALLSRYSYEVTATIDGYLFSTHFFQLNKHDKNVFYSTAYSRHGNWNTIFPGIVGQPSVSGSLEKIFARFIRHLVTQVKQRSPL